MLLLKLNIILRSFIFLYNTVWHVTRQLLETTLNRILKKKIYSFTVSILSIVCPKNIVIFKKVFTLNLSWFCRFFVPET